ncbi:MAG: CopG family antitoxin [Verrucomicrobiae bacterium]|nr:CopG family antitoxin [Verrucomicrobiae bacterium]
MKPAIPSRGFVPVEAKDSTQHLDLSQMISAPDMPKLKLSTETVTLRMPRSLLHNLKMLANKRDVPYQSLMKVLLSQAVDRELRHKAA